LDLILNAPNLSGFNYDLDLLYAAVANTYIETVGSHADSLIPGLLGFRNPFITKL
jgi:hypothetical protein